MAPASSAITAGPAFDHHENHENTTHMKTYTMAPVSVHDIIQGLIKKHYHDTLGAEGVGVKIDVLMAADDSDDGRAVVCQGYAALAVVRVTNLRERTAGRGDAEIVVDEAAFLRMEGNRRAALLDHELFHLELRHDRHKRPRRDALGRPLLALRKHDRQFGWFDVIAWRHGEASVEVSQARALRRGEAGQLYFEFANEGELAEAGVSMKIDESR